MDINVLRKKDRRRALRKERLFILGLLAYPMLLFVVFTVGTNVNSIILAFQNIDNQMNYSFAGFYNFAEVINAVASQGSAFFTGMVNSALLVFVSMIVSVPVSLYFSYYLYKKAMFSTVYRIAVMIPTIMSSLVSGLLLKSFILSIPDLGKVVGINNIPNLLDDPFAFPTILLITIWEGFGSGLILLANAMGAIDPSIIESGEIDGITMSKEVRYIVVPLIWPTISTFIILAISGVFAIMGPLYLFYDLDAPQGTVTIGYLIYKLTLGGGRVMYPQVSALGILCTLVVFPITLLARVFLEKLDPNE